MSTVLQTKILKAMRAKQLTAAELARRAGLTRQQVYNLVGHESATWSSSLLKANFLTGLMILEQLYPDLQLSDVVPASTLQLVRRVGNYPN